MRRSCERSWFLQVGCFSVGFSLDQANYSRGHYQLKCIRFVYIQLTIKTLWCSFLCWHLQFGFHCLTTLERHVSFTVSLLFSSSKFPRYPSPPIDTILLKYIMKICLKVYVFKNCHEESKYIQYILLVYFILIKFNMQTITYNKLF